MSCHCFDSILRVLLSKSNFLHLKIWIDHWLSFKLSLYPCPSIPALIHLTLMLMIFALFAMIWPPADVFSWSNCSSISLCACDLSWSKKCVFVSIGSSAICQCLFFFFFTLKSFNFTPRFKSRSQFVGKKREKGRRTRDVWHFYMTQHNRSEEEWKIFVHFRPNDFLFAMTHLDMEMDGQQRTLAHDAWNYNRFASFTLSTSLNDFLASFLNLFSPSCLFTQTPRTHARTQQPTTMLKNEINLPHPLEWTQQISAGFLIFDSISKWELIKAREKKVFSVPHTQHKKRSFGRLRGFSTRSHKKMSFFLFRSSFIWSIWLKICGDDWNYLIKHIAQRITIEAHHVAIVLRHCQSCWVVYVYKNLYRLLLCDPKTNQRWKRIRLLLIFFLSFFYYPKRWAKNNSNNNAKGTRMEKKMKKNISKRRIL